MKTPTRRDVGRDDLAMTSMIDVVFLLLVFFVWTSSFDRPERELAGEIALPAKTADQQPDPTDASSAARSDSETEPRREELIIRILRTDGPPRYQIGALEMSDFAAFQAKLGIIADLKTGAIVIIDPDGEIQTVHCVRVFDEVKRKGFSQVLFAVTAPR